MTGHPGPVEVVVVGGGIAGLAAALALTRAGRTVRVLERAAEFGEVGAGLQLAPNATRILREWGVLDDVIARGVRPRRLVLRDAVDGSALTDLDLADADRRYGAPYVVVHRSDLHTILLDACRRAGVDLVTDVAVDCVESGAEHVETVAGRRRDRAALVVAADGLGSTLRRRLSDDQPIDSGYVAYRGTAGIADLRAPSLVSPEDVVVYIGPGCHLVQYALRGGRMFNQVAVVRRAAIEGGGDLDGAFTGLCEAATANLAHLGRDRFWPMYDREPIGTWVDDRLALIGDAAHPMLQYLAQGACQAIEDAHCLAAPGVSLADYQRRRTVRTARVQRAARSWGELWHSDGLLRATRNALLTDRSTGDYRHIDWLYGAVPTP